MGSESNKSNNSDKQEGQSSKNSEQGLVLSDSTFLQLRDVIYKISGIYYSDSKRNFLESRVGKRVLTKNFSSFEEYIEFIQSIHSKQELVYLFESITINESYFFRADEQLDAFIKIIVPQIIEEKNKINKKPDIRIWCAGASTGEEPYTLAMMVLEKLQPKFPEVQFLIAASDLNKQIIETAKNGVYNESSIKNVPWEYLQKYFKKENTTYKLSDVVKKLVKFTQMNLLDQTAMKAMVNCDVIFCSNVLIYFDANSKEKVVSYLYNSLTKGGYLFLGYSESLHEVSKDFRLIHLPKAMAYKKD